MRSIPWVVAALVTVQPSCSSSTSTEAASSNSKDAGSDAARDVSVVDQTVADQVLTDHDIPDQGKADGPVADAQGDTSERDSTVPDGTIVDGASESSVQDAKVDTHVECTPPGIPVGAPTVVLHPNFAPYYTTYDLGQIPGAPADTLLGGCVIHYQDRNKLLIAVDSEEETGAIYQIGVIRDKCDHIIGFDGVAEKVVTAPYVDANLVYGPDNILFYTQWPVNQMSQVLPGAANPAVTTDLAALGVGDRGAGGLGFVPLNLSDPGGMRIVTWPGGLWYHLTYTKKGTTFAISNPVQKTALPNGPGGFAYVPAGSPGFSKQSIIMAEWSRSTVAVYEVDAQGDPEVSTRQPFYTEFPKPWGAYFEPLTGDYMFLTWGTSKDRLYIVQGFAKPLGPFDPE